MAKFVLTAQLRLQPPTNIGSVVSNIRSQLQGITATINVAVPPQAQAQIKNAQKNLNQTAKAAKQATTGITGFGEAAALAGKRFLAFTIAGGAVVRFASSIINATKEAIAFERQMNKIQQVTGSSAKSIGTIASEISRLSKGFGVSSNELSKAAQVLAQAGLTADETRKSLQALAKSDLAPTFDSITNTTEGAIAVFRQFKIEAEDLEGVLGSINAVAGKFAVESSDIVSAIRRTGGAFAAAGGSLNELLALFTSVRATTRESADSIATGFRTIFTRLQRVRTQNFLERMGINLKDLEGQFVGPYEAVRRLSTALKDLPGTDPRFAQIIEELGGFRQISKVIPLIQQFETSQKALNVAMAGTDSLSRDAAMAQNTLAVQIQKTREQFQAMIRNLTDSSGFKGTVKLALQLASALIKVVDSLKPLVPLLTAFGAVAVGRAIGPFFKGFRQKGGFGLGFAGGGLVPGTGNRDTVPAVLTPGEFVLRKDAVRALGLNKGGRVHIQKFEEGGKATESGFNASSAIANVKSNGVGAIALWNTLQTDSGTSELPRSGIIEQGKFKIKTSKNAEPIDIPYLVAGLSDEFSKRFENRASKTLIALNNNLGTKMAQELGATVSDKATSVKDIANYESIIGGLFEGAIITLGAPFTVNDAAFDFPEGIRGGNVKNWTGGEALTRIPVDAKRSWDRGQRKSIQDKTTAVLMKPEELRPIARATNEFKPGERFDPERHNNIFNFSKETVGSANKLAVALRRYPGGKYADARTVVGPDQKRYVVYGTTPTKFAKGGQVPALLTPGEVVIDKGTAQSIGYSTLEKMNYADKYASGGMVPKFASGFLPRNIGDIRRSRRRRLDEQGELTPQAKYLAKNRNRRFAQLGQDKAIERVVGYIDGDVLDDPANADVVKSAINKYKIKGGTKAYHDFLIKIARQKRKMGQIRRFKAIYGVPGAGKTSLVSRPHKGDTAKLRKTTRIPILTPMDIDRATEVVDTVAASMKAIEELQPGGMYSNVDRFGIMSTSTRAEQEEVKARRLLRRQQVEAGIAGAAQGRSAQAAAVPGAPLDSGAVEAIAMAELGKRRTAVMGVRPGFKLQRKTGEQIPELETKRLGLFYGALSPTTVGHADTMRLAQEAGIDPKDLIVAVSKIGGTASKNDEHSQRTAIFTQDFRKALARRSFPGATVVGAGPQDFAGTAPTVFERSTQGGRRKFVRAAKGSIAFVGDDKEEPELLKYRKSGYDVRIGARSEVSGTAARQAIMEGNVEQMKKLLTPGAMELVQKNQGRIQARAGVLPKLFERTEKRIGSKADVVTQELSQYPAQLTAQLKKNQPDVAAKITDLRKQRDAIKRLKEKMPIEMLRQLTRLFPQKYGFLMDEFASGGKVNAMLTPGEAVVSAPAVKRIGASKLAAFNNGGLVKKFANGGGVLGGDMIGRVAGLGFASASVSAFISNLDGVGDEFKQLANILTSGISQFAILFSATTALSNKFNAFATGKLDKRAAEQFGKQKDIRRRYNEKAGEYAADQQRLQRLRNRAPRKGIIAQRDHDRRLVEAQIKAEGSKVELAKLTLESDANKKAYGRTQRLRGILSKTNRIGGIAGPAFLGAATLSQSIGGYFAQRGRADLEAGLGGEDKLRYGTAASTAGSYASTGAAIGAMLGPLGMAAGAAIGGIWGWVKGMKDAEKEIKNIKIMKAFNTSLSELSRTLNSLNNQQTTLGEARIKINKLTTDTLKNLSDPNLSVDSRQDILAGVKGQLDGLNNYLTKTAEKSRTFGEFLSLAGEETLQFVANLSNISTAQLLDEFKKVQEAAEKARQGQLKLTETQDQYAQRLRNMLNLTKAFNTIALTMEKFDSKVTDVLNTLSDNVSVGQTVDESSLFSDPERFFDPTRFAEILGRDIARNPILNSSLSGNLGGALSNDIVEAEKAIRDLPNILLYFRDNVAAFETEQIEDQLVDQFSSSADFIRTAVRRVAQELIGSEGKSAELIAKLRDNFTGSLQQFTDAIKPALEIGATITKAMNTELNRRLKLIDDYNKIAKQEIDARIDYIDGLSQTEEILAKAFDRPENLDRKQALDVQKQATILGPDVGLLNNPIAIFNERLRTANDFFRDRAALERAEITEQNAILTRLQIQTQRMDNLNAALKFLSDISNRTSVTIQRLEKAQVRSNFRTKTLDSIMFADSLQSIRSQMERLQVAGIAADRGDINLIPPRLRGSLQSLLEETKGLGNLGIFGGRSSEDVTKDLRRNWAVNMGASREKAEEYAQDTTSEVEKQRQILINQLNIANTSRDLLAKGFDISLSTLSERFIDSINTFGSRLEIAIGEQRLQQLNDEKIRAEKERNKTEKAALGFASVQDFVSRNRDAAPAVTATNEEVTTNLINSLDLIKAYAKERETNKGLRQFRLEFAGAKKDYEGTTLQQNEALLEGKRLGLATVGQGGLNLVDIFPELKNARTGQIFDPSTSLFRARIGLVKDDQFTSEQRQQLRNAQAARLQSLGADEVTVSKFRDLISQAEIQPGAEANTLKGYLRIMDKAVQETIKFADLRGNTNQAETALGNLVGYADRIIDTGSLETFQKNIEAFNLDPKPYTELTSRVEELGITIATTSNRIMGLDFNLGTNLERLVTITGERSQRLREEAGRTESEINQRGQIAAQAWNQGDALRYQAEIIKIQELYQQMARLQMRIQQSDMEWRNYYAQVEAERKRRGFATGGFIPGRGSGDKIPALLEPGEFVLNRNAVAAVGAGNIARLNKRIPRFQSGGQVKMATGGMAIAGIDISLMEKAVKNFGTYVDKFGTFANSIKGLEISLRATHTVEVLLNGASVLAGMEESIRNIVITQTNAAINHMLDVKFGLPPMDK